MRNLKKKKNSKISTYYYKGKEREFYTGEHTLFIFLNNLRYFKNKKSPRVYNKIVPLLEGGGIKFT